MSPFTYLDLQLKDNDNISDNSFPFTYGNKIKGSNERLVLTLSPVKKFPEPYGRLGFVAGHVAALLDLDLRHP